MFMAGIALVLVVNIQSECFVMKIHLVKIHWKFIENSFSAMKSFHFKLNLHSSKDFDHEHFETVMISGNLLVVIIKNFHLLVKIFEK